MSVVVALVYAVLGWLAGRLHFALLARTVRAYVERRARARTVALQLARLAVLAAHFWLLARLGGALVLATLGGFLVARAQATRRALVRP